MFRPASNLLAAICLLAALFAAPDAAAVDIGADPAAAELKELGLEFQRVWDAHNKAVPADGADPADNKLSDEEWLRRSREFDAKFPLPDAELLPRFFEFAKQHPDSPSAFDALFVVIRRGGPQTGDVHGKPWQTKEEALDVVAAQHMDDPRVVYLFEQLGGSLPSHKTESFLRRAAEQGTDRSIQGPAAFHLARYYRTLMQAHARSRQLEKKPRLLNFERYWHLVVTPYLDQTFPIDEEQTSAQIDQLLALVRERFADIPVTKWELTGPGQVLLRARTDSPPKTCGDLARSMQFELDSIIPGKPAPEIEGSDADGQRFRLSDYKGNVVLLSFSANWCGGCVALYPLERKLVEKYRSRPFVMLGVNRDEKIDTLRADTASGEITWRCWWDGTYGPIRDSWNANGIPRLILLDHDHKFQDVALSRYTTQEEFEQAIETLLEKVPAQK